MCTLFIHRSKNSDWPILIANNRDEYLSRTFKSPGYHWNNSILAGKDISGIQLEIIELLYLGETKVVK